MWGTKETGSDKLEKILFIVISCGKKVLYITVIYLFYIIIPPLGRDITFQTWKVNFTKQLLIIVSLHHSFKQTAEHFEQNHH